MVAASAIIEPTTIFLALMRNAIFAELYRLVPNLRNSPTLGKTWSTKWKADTPVGESAAAFIHNTANAADQPLVAQPPGSIYWDGRT